MVETQIEGAPVRSLERWGDRLVLVVIGLMVVFYLATIRQGHDWGDDFAQYILHARNIVEGLPYDATGYIYNPSYPALGPKAYPPGFPLILAPIYRLVGFDLTALKITTFAFFFLALYVFYRMVRRELPAPQSMLLVVLLGLSPYFWDFKDQIVSDLPFLFFAVL